LLILVQANPNLSYMFRFAFSRSFIFCHFQSNYFDDSNEIHSLEVLNFDRNLIERQIETYKDRLKQEQLMELLEKSEHLNQIMIALKDKLKSGGRPAFSSM
jgi:hypothetical protein